MVSVGGESQTSERLLSELINVLGGDFLDFGQQFELVTAVEQGAVRDLQRRFNSVLGLEQDFRRGTAFAAWKDSELFRSF